jgi:general nucleoside transport system permease protein
MDLSLIQGILIGAILSGTSVLYATIGEVMVERTGIVNLGLEGVMLVGACTGFVTAVTTGNAALGVLVAAIAGGLFNLIMGFIVVNRRANQLASGLALMFLGMGLTALLGKPFVGSQITGIPDLPIPILSKIPFFGPVLFDYDILVYMVIPTAMLMWWILYRTRWGLQIRSVGESVVTSFAAGLNPALLRYQVLFLGGVLGGVGGAHISLAFTRTWVEGMTAGRGFIAVALVIFSMWHPTRAILGAFLFGGAVALQLQLQVRGVAISPFLLDMIPYLLTLIVLLAWGGSRKHNAPAMLGQVYEHSQ